MARIGRKNGSWAFQQSLPVFQLGWEKDRVQNKFGLVGD